MSGKQFCTLRESIGYSQARLSKAIDVSVRGISRWETGEIEIPKIAELALKYVVEKQLAKNRR
jgi:transcriptional regulator with XRE-family HTH domain